MPLSIRYQAQSPSAAAAARLRWMDCTSGTASRRHRIGKRAGPPTAGQDGFRRPSRYRRREGTSASCEQISTGRREADEGAALVHRQPAALDGQLHARAVLSRASLVLEQERAIDQLDVDAPILRRLDGAGDLDDA